MKTEAIVEYIYLGSEVQVKCCTAFYDLLMQGWKVTGNMVVAKAMGKDIYCFSECTNDDDYPDWVPTPPEF